MTLAWQWDPVRHIYVSPSGKELTQKDLVAIRDGLAGGFEEMAADIVMRHASGELTSTEFAGEFRAFIDESMRAQFLLGRGGMNAAVAADFDTMARLITDQLGYAEGFAADLAKGQMTQAEATARAEMYAGATVTAFEIGMAASHDQLELPAYPGDPDAVQCGSGCRCSWTIEEFDDRYEATWNAIGDSGTCSDCAENGQRWAPFIQMKTGAGG